MVQWTYFSFGGLLRIERVMNGRRRVLEKELLFDRTNGLHHTSLIHLLNGTTKSVNATYNELSERRIPEMVSARLLSL